MESEPSSDDALVGHRAAEGSSGVGRIQSIDISKFFKNIRARSPATAELSLTPKAEAAQEDLRKKLFNMLSAEALVRGHKRRASALDVTDYEAAFDDLLNPPTHPRWMDCAADIGLLLGGGFIGAGTNILTGSGNTGEAWIAIVAGGFVGAFSTAVKYIKA